MPPGLEEQLQKAGLYKRTIAANTRLATTPTDADTEVRRFTMKFSSEEPVKRYDWRKEEEYLEILSHDPADVDLSRLNNDAPLLKNHWDGRGVIESAEIKNGQGIATARLSNNDYAADDWRDIEGGIICNVSVGYRITERTLDKQAEGDLLVYRCKWQPIEISFLDVPAADSTAKIQRSDSPLSNFYARHLTTGEPPMPETQKRGDNAEASAPQPSANTEQPDTDTIRREAQQAEAERRNAIEAAHIPLQQQHPYLDWSFKAAIIDDPNQGLEDYNAGFIRALQQHHANIDATPTQVDVRGGESDIEKAVDGLKNALLARAGWEDIQEGNEFTGRSMHEMCRQLLLRHNVTSARSMDKQQLAQKVWSVRTGNHTSSDFAHVIAAVANKGLLKGYEQSESQVMRLANVGFNPDFKEDTRVAMSELGELEEIKEDGEITYTSLTDTKQNTQVKSHAKGIKLGRNLIINDDIKLLTSVPMKMGNMSRRTREKRIIQIFTNPPKIDGTLLFHANHKNLGTAAAISEASLKQAKLFMGKQKTYDESGEALGLRPKFIVTPLAKEDEAHQWMSSQHQPDPSNNVKINNRYQNWCEVISDARFDDASETAWYLSVDPTIYDALEITYLQGQEQPVFIENQQYQGMMGVEMVLFDDFNVTALDWRGLFKNAGA